MDYRPQQQMNDAWSFALSLMFMGLLLGPVKTLLSKAFGAEEEKPQLVARIAVEGGEPLPYQYRYLLSWLREPLPEYSLAVEPEVKERRIDAVLKQLKEGVEGVQNSQNFRRFLLTMAKFHDYSIGNLILIAMQKPDATRVAGFNTWKDLGRWVKKGEKGIAILAPVMPPRPACPVCGARIPRGARYCPQCGEPVELTPAYFKVVYVFEKRWPL